LDEFIGGATISPLSSRQVASAVPVIPPQSCDPVGVLLLALATAAFKSMQLRRATPSKPKQSYGTALGAAADDVTLGPDDGVPAFGA
jgi:hypothetical protein